MKQRLPLLLQKRNVRDNICLNSKVNIVIEQYTLMLTKYESVFGMQA